MLAYLITLALSSDEVKGANPELGGEKTENITIDGKFNRVTQQHLLLKVQINPAYNLGPEKYAGFPIDILSDDNDLITRGTLDVNGFVRFDLLAPFALKQIHIYSPVTKDKITVKNPSGSMVIGFYVAAVDDIMLKGINVTEIYPALKTWSENKGTVNKNWFTHPVSIEFKNI